MTVVFRAPSRTDYRPIVKAQPLDALPFITLRRDAKPGHKYNFWDVPTPPDYGVACEVGREYAGHYLQFIKDNELYAGMGLLASFAHAMDLEPFGMDDKKGYRVGFFSYIEKILYLYACQNDVFADIDHEVRTYAQLAQQHAHTANLNRRAAP